MSIRNMSFKRTLTATTLLLPLLAFAAGADAKPLAKVCGPNNKYVIGFSQANFAEPYRQHVNNDLTTLAKQVPQFELQIADAAGNDNTQVSQVENFMTQGVDLLLISPFEAAPLSPVVTRVFQSGVPSLSSTAGRWATAARHLSAATTPRSPTRRAPTPPRPCCPAAARSPCWRACPARRRRSSG